MSTNDQTKCPTGLRQGIFHENTDCDDDNGCDGTRHIFGPDDDEVGPGVNEHGYRYSEMTTEEILAQQFETEVEAYDFYCGYAKSIGFAVRKDEISRDKKGNVLMRQFVCNRQGSRHRKHLERVDRVREHRALTRTKCRARLRVVLKGKERKYESEVAELKGDVRMYKLALVVALSVVLMLIVALAKPLSGQTGGGMCMIM